jgi:hypothetical protein
MKQVKLLRTAASEQAYLRKTTLQVMAGDWLCQRCSWMYEYSVTAASMKNITMVGAFTFVQYSVHRYVLAMT